MYLFIKKIIPGFIPLLFYIKKIIYIYKGFFLSLEGFKKKFRREVMNECISIGEKQYSFVANKRNVGR